MEGIVGEGVTITLDAPRATCAPSTIMLQPRQAPALHASSATPAATPKLHLFGQIQRIARAWLDEGYLVTARAAPIRRSSSTRRSPTGGRADHGRDHRDAAAASGRSRRCSTPTIRPARPGIVNFTTSQGHAAGQTGPQPQPRQLRRLRQRLGGRVLPRRRGPSARAAPMSRTRRSASRCPTATAASTRRYLPDFIVRLDDGTAPTIRSTSSSRSRAIAARTPRRRRRRCDTSGCRA